MGVNTVSLDGRERPEKKKEKPFDLRKALENRDAYLYFPSSDKSEQHAREKKGQGGLLDEMIQRALTVDEVKGGVERHQDKEVKEEPKGEQIEVARRQLERAVSALDDIRESLTGNRETWEAIAATSDLSIQFIEQVRESTNDLLREIRELFGDSHVQLPEDGLAVLASAAAVNGDIQAIEDGSQTSEDNLVTKLVKAIKTRWEEFTRWLNSAIAHLAKPKEWSISGGISLGWLANASISVTFGESG
jgi:hypothetical protein